MSFRACARYVRNPDLPFHTRLSAVRSCALHLSTLLKKENRSDVLDPITHAYNLNDPNGPTEQELLSALAVLERNREAFLNRLRAFEQKRVEEKYAGIRWPSEDEITQLYDFDLDLDLR
ncbi:MAG: hypothetical protein JXA25_12675 [Anaerolineales bacterium]|nr:hypothetical protein [Anaerolineales bacterium]